MLQFIWLFITLVVRPHPSHDGQGTSNLQIRKLTLLHHQSEDLPREQTLTKTLLRIGSNQKYSRWTLYDKGMQFIFG